MTSRAHKLRVRSDPRTKAPVIGYLQYRETVLVIGLWEGWCKLARDARWGNVSDLSPSVVRGAVMLVHPGLSISPGLL